jgi:hypothetical protein
MSNNYFRFQEPEKGNHVKDVIRPTVILNLFQDLMAWLVDRSRPVVLERQKPSLTRDWKYLPYSNFNWVPKPKKKLDQRAADSFPLPPFWEIAPTANLIIPDQVGKRNRQAVLPKLYLIITGDICSRFL